MGADMKNATAATSTAREMLGAAPVEPLKGAEPPARIIIDPPIPEALSSGRVVIQYYAENLHIADVFGEAALAVSPRIGHVHISVDDATWRWVDASGQPIILNGFAPGSHKVRIQLVDANHHLIDEGTVEFNVPSRQTNTTIGEVNG
jgi:hypothetical protein